MPLATSILKSYACSIADIDIELVNFTINSDPANTADILLNKNPDSIGFSLYLWNSAFFEKVAEIIREMNSSIILYAGGAEVTASSERLQNTGLFDHLIPGEGEMPFKLLMESLMKNKNTEAILTRQHETDINLIPSPYLSGTLNPSEYDGLLWELSRGCPFNCSFCCESRGISGVRYYDSDRIRDELRLFEEKGVEQIWVLDPTFNVKKDRALTILNMIEEIAPQIHFTFEVRAELLDEEIAEAFSRIHCSLQIGLQSSSDDVLKKLNRTIKADEFIEKIALLNKYGVVFGLDLIYGLPGDSISGFKQSLDFAVELIPNHLDIFRLSVFPGTELYDEADSLGLIFNEKPPYEVLRSRSFSENELNSAENLSIATDLFYNSGKAAPWLMPLLDSLDKKPNEFFQLFADFIAGLKVSSENIAEIQSDFLIKLLSHDEDDDVLAVTLDLLNFHHLFNNSLYGNIEYRNSQISDFPDSHIFVKNSVLQWGVFSYDVTLYYELGMFDLKWFIGEFERDVSYGLVFNIHGEIQVMAVDKIYFQFLQSIDGKRTFAEILKLINTKADELSEFISFLAENELIGSL